MNAPTISAAELQNLHKQMMQLTVRVGLALDRAGVDIGGATVERLPGDVVDLAAYRRTRGGAA